MLQAEESAEKAHVKECAEKPQQKRQTALFPAKDHKKKPQVEGSTEKLFVKERTHSPLQKREQQKPLQSGALEKPL